MIYRDLYPGYTGTCIQDIQNVYPRYTGACIQDIQNLYPGYTGTCIYDIQGPILRIITVYLVREIPTPVL